MASFDSLSGLLPCSSLLSRAHSLPCGFCADTHTHAGPESWLFFLFNDILVAARVITQVSISLSLSLSLSHSRSFSLSFSYIHAHDSHKNTLT